VRGGSHGCIKFSAMLEILMAKFSDSHKTLFFDAHTGCLCIGCMYIEGTHGLVVYRVSVYVD
jgi:hypothetical protein